MGMEFNLLPNTGTDREKPNVSKLVPNLRRQFSLPNSCQLILHLTFLHFISKPTIYDSHLNVNCHVMEGLKSGLWLRTEFIGLLFFDKTCLHFAFHYYPHKVVYTLTSSLPLLSSGFQQQSSFCISQYTIYYFY
jgi:hypothetical protein